MKPLIFVLLATITAEAQSLAELARRERARQAQVTSSRAISMDNSGVAAITAASSAGTSIRPGATPPPPAAPSTDPARKYAEDVVAARLRVRELQDQESALLLQLNDLNAQFLAPISNPDAKDAAQGKIRDAQQKLGTARLELTTARTLLQQLEAQAPTR